jgi:hypothetical protein
MGGSLGPAAITEPIPPGTAMETGRLAGGCSEEDVSGMAPSEGGGIPISLFAIEEGT